MLMVDALDSSLVRAWLARAASVLRTQRDELTRLDAAIGDGDHGLNMSRGFDAVETALASEPQALPGPLLILAGKTLIATVGGNLYQPVEDPPKAGRASVEDPPSAGGSPPCPAPF